MKIFNNNLIIDIVLDSIYPTRCTVCEKILEKSEIKSGFCKCCRSIITFTGEDTCMTCGRILADKSRELCCECENRQHAFIQAKAVYEYSGPMKDAIYRFKYGNCRTYGKFFAKDAYRTHSAWIKNVSPAVIIPVPMYEKKKCVRGYNQAEVFAEFLSEITGIPCVSDAIIRDRDTKPLKTLSPLERKANLKNTFKNVKIFRRSTDILIVDDIFTTGATIDEVAATLKMAKAGKIYGLFICTGKADLHREV